MSEIYNGENSRKSMKQKYRVIYLCKKEKYFMDDKALAYLLLRVTLGIDMFIHGMTRLFGEYAGFVANILKEFQDTILPQFSLLIFAWSLPPLEALVGILLLIGFCTRFATCLGAILIAVLVFGSSLKHDWNTVGIQMAYALIYYFLILNLQHNRFSMDHWIKKRHRANKIGFS